MVDAAFFAENNIYGYHVTIIWLPCNYYMVVISSYIIKNHNFNIDNIKFPNVQANFDAINS